MEQFSLEKYLENTSRKVVTRSGHNVRILCTDQRGNMPIVALVEFETLDGVQIFYSDGKNESHREYDIFFADEKDNFADTYQFNTILHTLDLKAELFKKQDNQEEYNRWKGLYEWLKSKKDLIIKSETNKPNEPQENPLNEFEKELSQILFEREYTGSTVYEEEIEKGYKKFDKDAKMYAPKLLELASKELNAPTESNAKWWYEEGLREGKRNTLKDLPKWKKITEEKQNYLAYGYLSHDGYYLSIQELKDKLPKEK